MARFSRRPKGGFLPIFLALMVTTVLTGLGLGLGMQTVLSQQKKVEWLNRAEGYYAGELGAWHHWLRNQEELSSGDDKYTLILENEPWRGIASAPVTGGHPGMAQDFAVTSQFAQVAALVRRYDGSNLTTSRGFVAGSSCGQIRLGAKRKSYALCLIPTKVPSFFVSTVVHSDPENPLSVGNSILTILGFDKAGALVRGWGTNGIIRHRMLTNADGNNAALLPMPIPFGARLLSFDYAGLVGLLSDGTVDPLWSDNGVLSLPNGNGSGFHPVSEIREQTLLQSYRTDVDAERHVIGLVRILDGGKKDPTFQLEGSLIEATPGLTSAAFHTLDSGKIRTCSVWNRNANVGETVSDMVLIIRQFTSTGRLDSFFGEGGSRSIELGDVPGVHVPHVFSDGSAAIVHLTKPVGNDGVTLTPSLTVITSSGDRAGQSELGAIFWGGLADEYAQKLISFWDDGFVIFSVRSMEDGTNRAHFFTRSGQVDAGMGANGTTDILLPSDPRLFPHPLKVVRDSEGTFLFLIEARKIDGSGDPMKRNADHLTLVKLDSRGKLDPSFGDRGRVDIFDPPELGQGWELPTVGLNAGN